MNGFQLNVPARLFVLPYEATNGIEGRRKYILNTFLSRGRSVRVSIAGATNSFTAEASRAALLAKAVAVYECTRRRVACRPSRRHSIDFQGISSEEYWGRDGGKGGGRRREGEKGWEEERESG